MTDESTIKDLFHVAGDAPDPTGGNLRGVAAGYDLTKSAIGHPMLLYRVGSEEMILEADVYELEGLPLHVRIICPICLAMGRTSGLTIWANQKGMQYEAAGLVPIFPGWTAAQMRQAFGDRPGGAGGRLSVEPFRCTWEATPELTRRFGLAQCPWNVAIENNVVRDIK